MARRYSRDNKGRFASSGTGATARGGRLRTAAGNKRATQTTKAAAAKPSGTVAGKVKRNPAAAGKIGKAKAATKRPARIKGAKINSLDAPNKASSAPKGTIGKTGKIRTAQAFDRNLAAAKLNAPAGRKNAVSVEQRYKTTTSDFASLGGSASGRLTRKQLDKRQRQGQKILNPTSSITDVSPTYSGMSSSMKQRVKEARATRFEGYKSAISAKRTAKPAAAKPAKAAAKPAAPKAAKRKAIGAISEAKAARIISRIDANRPGLRKATGSARKTQNSIRTQGKATDFALAAGARARKQGKSLSVNESLQRGVKNATAKSRKSPKTVTPAAAKPPANSQAANKIELAKGRASVMQKQKDSQNKQLKEINAKIKEAGPNAGGLRLQKLQIQSRLQEARSNLAQAKAASRPDTAASNIPMRGARGRALNAEISRNVNAQKTASRAASKAIGRQLKSDQSRAKKLREVHLGPLAAGYAQRSGRKVADVKAAISGMAPSGQIKLFRQYVRENRKKK
jgi:hypothetical protein